MMHAGYTAHTRQHELDHTDHAVGRMEAALNLDATGRTPHGFAFGPSNVWLVGENPTCSVPTSYVGMGGSIWSYDYDHE